MQTKYNNRNQKHGEESMRKESFALLVAAAITAATMPATADEAQLKLLRFASEDTPYTQTITKMVEYIDSKGKGLVHIEKVVGPEAVPVNQMGTALKSGIVDIIIAPPSYVSNLQPGMQGLSAMRTSPQDQRKNGTYDLVNGAIAKSLNAIMIGQLGWGTNFNIFLREPIASIDDFKGKRIRTTNTYRRFIEALGAQPFRASRSEIYTAMERGVISGFVNQKMEVLSAGWNKVTGFMVDPPFYNGMAVVLVNLNTWHKLSDKQREFMTNVGQTLENKITVWMADANRNARAGLIKAGVKVIQLPPDQAKKYENLAYQSTWNGIDKIAPEFGPKLRKAGMVDK
jgi:TRAP-type C4-dicarboxylate transport system substrate-binding protein